MIADQAHGGCLCGAVRFTAEGELDGVVFCHCGQCRRQTGLHVAATRIPAEKLTISRANDLRWFASSDVAERGFCSRCGSGLFWRRTGGPNISIFAGAFDDGTALRSTKHIYVADKPDWYEIGDELPQHRLTDPG